MKWLRNQTCVKSASAHHHYVLSGPWPSAIMCGVIMTLTISHYVLSWPGGPHAIQTNNGHMHMRSRSLQQGGVMCQTSLILRALTTTSTKLIHSHSKSLIPLTRHSHPLTRHSHSHSLDTHQTHALTSTHTHSPGTHTHTHQTHPPLTRHTPPLTRHTPEDTHQTHQTHFIFLHINNPAYNPKYIYEKETTK